MRFRPPRRPAEPPAPVDAGEANRLGWERIRRSEARGEVEALVRADPSGADDQVPSRGPEPWALLNPWAVDAEDLQRIRRLIEDLGTAIADSGLGEVPQEKLGRHVGACARLAQGWEEAGDVLVDADRLFEAAGRVKQIRVVTEVPLGDLAAQVSACVVNCRIPLRLAVELASLWAALLDETQAEPIGLLLKASLTG